jgi:hypothetical protein
VKDTFFHCRGDQVTRLWVTARMEHPSRKGAEYDLDFTHRGEPDASLLGGTTEDHGMIHEDIGTEGGQGLGNGPWGVVFRDGVTGRVIGRSSIRLRPTSGPGCERR